MQFFIYNFIPATRLVLLPLMRLINIHTLELEYFHNDPPPFAILSHSWGAHEVTLQDVRTLPRSHLDTLEGWRKVTGFCAALDAEQNSILAHNNGESVVRHAWVDTCCIDKTSSAELSEAINSMFRWYRGAVACFVLLSDVGGPGANHQIEASRWFRRGWTLQELLAPREVYFFDRDWQLLGDKMGLSERIAWRTGIDLDVILTGQWEGMSVAQRMSWAADRQTTRREDVAYCLMGIFDVNMPLLYGEGDKAFIRLQEEILKESADTSILAWDASDKDESLSAVGALATHPSQFRGGVSIEALPSDRSLAVTQRGIQSTVPIMQLQDASSNSDVTVAVLDCRYTNDLSSRVGIPVRMLDNNVETGTTPQYVRTRAAPMCIPLRQPLSNMKREVYLVKRDQAGRDGSGRALRRCWVRYGAMADGFEPVLAVPAEYWHTSPARSMTMGLPRRDGIVITAIAFRFTGSPGPIRYCVVLRMDPGNGTGTVHLGRVELGSDTDHMDGLGMYLMKAIRDAETVAASESAELLMREWKLRNSMQASLVVRDSGTMFDLVLSARTVPWPAVKPKLDPF